MDEPGEVTIRIAINPLWGEKAGALEYRIDREQARELMVGPRPPDFDGWNVRDWQMRMDRAEKFAQLIAADLAHRLIRAFNQES